MSILWFPLLFQAFGPVALASLRMSDRNNQDDIFLLSIDDGERKGPKNTTPSAVRERRVKAWSRSDVSEGEIDFVEESIG
jgi:hypothetical protein